MRRSRSRPHVANPALRRLLFQFEKLNERLHAMLAMTEGLQHLPAEEPPPGLQRITPTEWKVWRRITDDEDEKYEVIYPELGMSRRNFNKHVNRLFGKLGVHKRSGAARLWEKYGKKRDGR